MAEVQLFDAIEKLRYENSQYHTMNFDEQKTQTKNSQELTKTVGQLLEEFRGMREDGVKDAEEQRRESGKSGASAPDSKKTDSKIEREQFELKGVLQVLAGIGASLAGFVVGIAAGIKNMIKVATILLRSAIDTQVKKLMNSKAIKGLKNIFSPLQGTAGRISTFIKDTFTKFNKNVTRIFTNLTKSFKAGMDGVKGLSRSAKGTFRSLNVFEKLFRTFGKGVVAVRKGISGVVNVFKGLQFLLGTLTASARELDAFADLKKVFSEKLIKPFQNFMKGIRGVGESTSKLGKTLGKFFGAFKFIGRFVAFPLTVIMGLIDGIKGMFAGAKRQEGFFNKLVGGFVGIFTGVVKGLVGMPLDLIKDLISWIAGKLGFENFSKALDSFSFSGIIQKIGDGIADFFVGFTDGIVYNLKNIFANIMKPFEGGFSFGGLMEFVYTIPLKLYAGFLDLMKTGLSGLLGLFGATDMQKSLESFSFSDEMEKVIDWVKALPAKALDGLMSLVEGIDIGAMFDGLGDFASMAAQKLKDLVRSLLPDPDSLAGALVPNALYDFVDAPVPPPKEVKKETAGGEENAPEIEDRATIENELAVAKKQLQQDKLDLDAAIQARDTGDGDEYAVDQAKLFTELSQSQIDDLQKKLKTFETKSPEAPTTTPQKSKGQQVSELSKEIAQESGKSAPVVISAPSQSNVTNNNQSTAAIIDSNLPTVDNNDRTYHYAM